MSLRTHIWLNFDWRKSSNSSKSLYILDYYKRLWKYTGETISSLNSTLPENKKKQMLLILHTQIAHFTEHSGSTETETIGSGESSRPESWDGLKLGIFSLENKAKEKHYLN
jgi:hypothetical protein